eukprot:762623-Hanusia_phi.AAC.2
MKHKVDQSEWRSKRRWGGAGCKERRTEEGHRRRCEEGGGGGIISAPALSLCSRRQQVLILCTPTAPAVLVLNVGPRVLPVPSSLQPLLALLRTFTPVAFSAHKLFDPPAPLVHLMLQETLVPPVHRIPHRVPGVCPVEACNHLRMVHHHNLRQLPRPLPRVDPRDPVVHPPVAEHGRVVGLEDPHVRPVYEVVRQHVPVLRRRVSPPRRPRHPHQGRRHPS